MKKITTFFRPRSSYRRDKDIQERGKEVVLVEERNRARDNPRTNQDRRSARNRARDAGRRDRASAHREVCRTRGELPYPRKLDKILEKAILDFFKKWGIRESASITM